MMILSGLGCGAGFAKFISSYCKFMVRNRPPIKLLSLMINWGIRFEEGSYVKQFCHFAPHLFDVKTV